MKAAVSGRERQKLGVYVDSELWRRIKIRAAELRTDATSIVEVALEQYLVAAGGKNQTDGKGR